MSHYWLDHALLPHGWARHVRVSVNEWGLITAVEPGATREGAIAFAGSAVPGMPNCHSHAFQRAMAGCAERASVGDDDFWSWRKIMYALAAQITPQDLNAIAAQLYVEMLKAGYTSVAEFHYLHHAPAHADILEMSEAVMHAAELSGIRHTHLPVLYQTSQFGGHAPEPHQQRFVLSVDEYLRLLHELDAKSKTRSRQHIGLAFHSLRAVPPQSLTEVLESRGLSLQNRPVHIHIAEQTAEVDACLRWSGQRPVEWLLTHAPVNRQWCLVHATHMQPQEVTALAQSAAVVGLCPTTEANLGDGLFPLPAYLQSHGALSIGSDSHVSVSPVEELRWLEYGQRLALRRRNVSADLWPRALAGGAAALGQPTGAIAPGNAADFIVLDTSTPAFASARDDQLLDRFIFTGNINPIRHVIVGGNHVVRDGRHVGEEEIAQAFHAAMTRLQEPLRN